MGIVNRRNAVLGWAAWKIGKQLLKRKARGAVGGWKGASAVATGLVAAVGLGWLVRRLRGGEDAGPDE